MRYFICFMLDSGIKYCMTSVPSVQRNPFQRLVSQGMILGEVEYTAHIDDAGRFVSANKQPSGHQTMKLHADDVKKKGDGFVLVEDETIKVNARAHKMSKSRGNVVNPDEIVRDFGAEFLAFIRNVHGTFA